MASPEGNRIFFGGGGEILTIRPLIEKILARREKKIDFTDFYFYYFFFFYQNLYIDWDLAETSKIVIYLEYHI